MRAANTQDTGAKAIPAGNALQVNERYSLGFARICGCSFLSIYLAAYVFMNLLRGL